MNKKMISLMLIVFSMFFSVQKVDALKCEYEMFPINIGRSQTCTDENGNQILCAHSWGDGSTKAKIVVDMKSKKDYTINEKSNFGRKAVGKFDDDSFVKDALKKGECPTYIERYSVLGNDEIKKVKDKAKFLEKIDTMYDTTDAHKYYAVLVKQDDKVKTEGTETVLTYATCAWESFVSQKEYQNDPTVKSTALELENAFIKGVESSSIASTIKDSDTWKNYKKIKNKRHQTAADQKTLERAQGDYCYFYCEKVYCANKAGNKTAMNECKKPCETNQKVTCQEAYNTCADAEDVDDCMKTALTNKGLDSNYVELRSKGLTELETKIEDESGRFAVTKLKKINLKYGTYKLKCEDVEDLHKFWVVIKVLAPILVILMGSADFLISIVSGDEEKIKKARNKFPKRLIAALLIFLASFIISLIVGLSSNSNVKSTTLLDCIVNGKK